MMCVCVGCDTPIFAGDQEVRPVLSLNVCCVCQGAVVCVCVRSRNTEPSSTHSSHTFPPFHTFLFHTFLTHLLPHIPHTPLATHFSHTSSTHSSHTLTPFPHRAARAIPPRHAPDAHQQLHGRVHAGAGVGALPRGAGLCGGKCCCGDDCGMWPWLFLTTPVIMDGTTVAGVCVVNDILFCPAIKKKSVYAYGVRYERV